MRIYRFALVIETEPQLINSKFSKAIMGVAGEVAFKIEEFRRSLNRKTVSISLATVLAASLLTGCGGGAPNYPVYATHEAMVAPYQEAMKDYASSENLDTTLYNIEQNAPNSWSSSFNLKFIDEMGNDFGVCSGVAFNYLGNSYVFTANHCIAGYQLPIKKIVLTQPHNRMFNEQYVDVAAESTVWNSDIKMYRVEGGVQLPEIPLNSNPYLPDDLVITSLTFPLGSPIGIMNVAAQRLTSEEALEFKIIGGREKFFVPGVNVFSPGSSGGGIFSSDGTFIGIAHAVTDPEKEVGFLFETLPDLLSEGILP